MRTPLFVLADDLTGACEIAGLAATRGGRARVLTTSELPDLAGVDLLVLDTETRLLRPVDAARKTAGVAEILLQIGAQPFFKKTDSMLRGPVAAELEALAAAFGYERVLLVAGNPALGRVVAHGCLSVNGTPVHQTEFAIDPHHPARSDRVANLLGPVVHAPVHVVTPEDRELPLGLLVGDARSKGELQAWARRLPTDTLAAGGAAWFEALLPEPESASVAPSSPPSSDSGHLLLSGTTSQAQRQQLSACAGFEPFSVEELKRDALAHWLQRLAHAWQTSGRAAAAPTGAVTRESGTAERIRAALAAAALRAVRQWGVRHLIIEGGSTAFSILSALGWRDLSVVHSWAPGVVSVRPAAAPDCLLTLKPGSYPWPPALLNRLSSAPNRVSAS